MNALKLVALDDQDLKIVSAHVQDAVMKVGDIVVLTADHGCDPTWRGTDHTRERVPIMAFGPGIRSRSVGIRPTYADIGETVARHLGLAAGIHGKSFL